MDPITRESLDIINRALLDGACLHGMTPDQYQEMVDEFRNKVVADEENDKVNHPQHYNQINGVECIDVIEQMPFNTGNAMKYLWRYLDKGEPITDLEKAKWYIDREITRLREEF